MSPFSPELFLSTLALIGAVIVISALFSGVIERTGVPQVASSSPLAHLSDPQAFR